MSAIDREALFEMCDKINLLEYAEQTMEFKRKGNSYFTSCPKHSDSDPSLCISPEKNLYHCFSCNRSGNIISWMRDFEGLTTWQAIQKVSEITGTDVGNIRISIALKCLKDIKRLAEKSIVEQVDRQILPYEYYEKRFSKEIPEEWVKEGISPEVMDEYDIRVDNKLNRICYPIFDNQDRLIGVKGRTKFEDPKKLNVSKYMNYTSIKTTDFFVGMKNNRDAIRNANSVIIFEGIKSGLKLATWGEPHNWLAAETKRINEAQIRILLEMKIKEIIIAFDRDVTMEELQQSARMLKRFCNVYAVRDRYNKNRLLPGNKDSPVDAGFETWKTLLKEKIRL